MSDSLRSWIVPREPLRPVDDAAAGLDDARTEVRPARRTPRRPADLGKHVSPPQTLRGMRVLLSGPDRGRGLEDAAIAAGAFRARGAEIALLVGAEDRSATAQRVLARFPSILPATSVADALRPAALDAPPPRFVCALRAGAEIQSSALHQLMLEAGRSSSRPDVLHVPTFHDQHGALLPKSSPPIWLARVPDLRRALQRDALGAMDVQTRHDVVAVLV